MKESWWQNFLFGLCFGLGFSIAGAVMTFIVDILSKHKP